MNRLSTIFNSLWHLLILKLFRHLDAGSDKNANCIKAGTHMWTEWFANNCEPEANTGYLAHPIPFVFVQKPDKFCCVANSMRTIRRWRSAGLQFCPHICAFGSHVYWALDTKFHIRNMSVSCDLTRQNAHSAGSIMTFASLMLVSSVTDWKECMGDKFKLWRASWENKLTLGVKTVKNTDYMKIRLKQKMFRIQFPTKNWVGTHVNLPLRVELKNSKDCLVWNILIYWNRKIDHLRIQYCPKYRLIWKKD